MKMNCQFDASNSKKTKRNEIVWLLLTGLVKCQYQHLNISWNQDGYGEPRSGVFSSFWYLITVLACLFWNIYLPWEKISTRHINAVVMQEHMGGTSSTGLPPPRLLQTGERLNALNCCLPSPATSHSIFGTGLCKVSASSLFFHISAYDPIGPSSLKIMCFSLKITNWSSSKYQNQHVHTDHMRSPAQLAPWAEEQYYQDPLVRPLTFVSPTAVVSNPGLSQKVQNLPLSFHHWTDKSPWWTAFLLNLLECRDLTTWLGLPPQHTVLAKPTCPEDLGTSLLHTHVQLLWTGQARAKAQLCRGWDLCRCLVRLRLTPLRAR